MSGKLKGIYEALDHGNWKNALKLCTAFLQKQKDHALCKALQAAALDRCGRRDEALQLCDEVRAAGEKAAPGAAAALDDTVLNTLQVVYRRCRQMSMIQQMYEAIVQKEPDNEDMAVLLFACAMRAADFAKAQQVASKLYGKFKKPKYLHWVITSILLQVQAGGPPKALDLASMMLQKAPVAAEPAPTGEGQAYRGPLNLLLLHLSTLRQCGKHAEALEMLKEFECHVRLPADVAAMRVQLLRDAGRVVDATREAREQVLREPDNWGTAQDYIRLAFECPLEAALEEALPRLKVPASETSGEAAEIPDHGARLRASVGSAAAEPPAPATLEEIASLETADQVWNALLLFRHLQLQRPGGEEQAAKGSLGKGRVPFLAELELRRLTFCASEAALLAASPGREGVEAWRAAVAGGDIEDFVRLIGTYIERFADRGSCYFDLKPFLCLLKESEQESLITASRAGSEGPDREVNLARLRRGLRRLPVDGLFPVEEEAERVATLLAKCVDAQGSGPGRTDEFLLLSIVTLADMDRGCSLNRTEGYDRGLLLDALALANMGMAAAPRTFHFKVLLVILYGALGAPGLALNWYGTADIKNIQHESLSYLMLDRLCIWGAYDNLRDLCRYVEGFHEDFDKDGGEALSTALNHGALQRVPEYLESLSQMNRSVLWGRAVVEETLCEVGLAQSWETMVEELGRQGVLLGVISSRPADIWTLRNQDRCLLNGLHPLPFCTPLSASSHTAQARRDMGMVPTMLVQCSKTATMCSSALVWSLPKVSGVAAAKSAKRPPASAVQELLAQGVEGSATHLRLSASLLQLLVVLVQKEPNKERVAELLSASREALPAAQEAWPEACAGARLQEDSTAGLAACWSSSPSQFMMHSWRAALSAGETAHVVLTCLAGDEAWGQAETRLSQLSQYVHDLVECARDCGADPGLRPFTLGRRGVPLLWAFLNGCAAILVPVALWCCGAIPKAGGGKKVKEGQEALYSTRVALRNLITTLQTSFADLQADIAGVLDGDASELLPFSRTAARGGKASQVVTELERLTEFRKSREQVTAALAESQRKHLLALKEALVTRQALLKSRTFKP